MLPSPDLDDRRFDDLLAEALGHVRRTCPEWTDLSPGDPGTTLLEAFAYVTDVLLYRLNRVPDKVYVELLRLLGVGRRPPAAARVRLRFERSRAGGGSLAIPRGTRVTTGRGGGSGGEGPVFTTVESVQIPAGETTVEVDALHAELVEAEPAGRATGLPGFTVTAARAPVIAPSGDDLDLVVGVEAREGELTEREPALTHGGRTWRVWREVESFTGAGPEEPVYLADRFAGRVTFAPAVRRLEAEDPDAPRALAAVPRQGREVRLWYRRGGGPEGNVAADALTVLKDPLPGVEVTNPAPATGGRAAEELDNALLRGPQAVHSLSRAVTARDFELLAIRSSGAVERARAFTQSALWVHAAPGTVEVVLVPHLPEDERLATGGGTAARLLELATAEARRRIQSVLDERRPLGTRVQANWAKTKEVRVEARVVCHREEDPRAVEGRLLERLHGTVNPLPTSHNATGWRFGEPLRASRVYDVLLSEPGVAYADEVRLVVTELPRGEIPTLAADAFQPATWYAGCGPILFRSTNDGAGWEPAGRFGDGRVRGVRPHPDRAGLLAVVVGEEGEPDSRLHVSRDCGETWEEAARLTFQVEDLAWMLRQDRPVLLMATDRGLYELVLDAGAGPVQVLVEPDDSDLGFYAVAASRDLRGQVSVAVASQGAAGVYLSSEGGRPETFRRIGLDKKDVRVLEVQYDGPRAFLWAGVAASGPDDPGEGAWSWELRGSADPPEGWLARDRSWQGGSCLALAFAGSRVFAGSHRAGVLALDAAHPETHWSASGVASGLPPREPSGFLPVAALAAGEGGGGTERDAGGDARVLAGGPEGLWVSTDGGARYSTPAAELIERVTLPETWLFTSGDHRLDVVSEDEVG